MTAAPDAVAIRRWTVGASVAVVVLVASMASARALSPEPAAVITDANGTPVATVVDRSKGPAALEFAVARRAGTGLRLEYLYRSHGTIVTQPNDPYFSDQWNLPVIGSASAWEHTDGEGIVIAVLDSGINFTGTDGICASIVAPYDAVEQREGLAPLNVSAPFGHGTHIAGTIAACTNNAIGGVGLSPGVSLMPVRILSDDGTGTSTQLAAGLDWAVEHGADVINMSLGGDCGSTWPSCGDVLVDAAIERARAADIVLVASSGNSGSSFVAYPSAHPYVVSVGAVGRGDTVWSEADGGGSNTGSALDLVAPGVEILAETTNLGQYGYYLGTGTSMAAPHVSAAAAEILAVNPELTVAEVVSLLRYNAVDLGPSGFDAETGWGRLDVSASIDAAAATLLDVVMAKPCTAAQCDSIVRVDSSGRWGLWAELTSATSVSSFFYGDPGDYPFMGDWDGDGIETPGLYRQSDGYVYLRNVNTQGIADIKFYFGDPGDVPIAGDFNGDGKDTVSIYRPSNQTFYIINKLGSNDGGLGAAELSYVFGNPGDKPFVGDFNGDGIETVGLHRESTGLVYLRNTHAVGNADAQFIFGDPGDQILAGDWDGDGDDTVAVYRPSTGRLYVSLDNVAGVSDWDAYVGLATYIIAAGNHQ